jgi:hypothetical protein
VALCLDSLLMAVDDDDAYVNLARIRVPLAGAVKETGDLFGPYRLIDGDGQPVVPVTGFLRSLQAVGRSEATQRSYSMDLLRWFRLTWAAGFEWDHATRAEARDFSRWLQMAGKPERDHWRTGRPAGPGAGPAPGTVNKVTGKASQGPGYAASTVAHCETVCRSFYDYHLETGAGPLANPFPLARKGSRANARLGQAVGSRCGELPYAGPEHIDDYVLRLDSVPEQEAILEPGSCSRYHPCGCEAQAQDRVDRVQDVVAEIPVLDEFADVVEGHGCHALAGHGSPSAGVRCGRLDSSC